MAEQAARDQLGLALRTLTASNRTTDPFARAVGESHRAAAASVLDVLNGLNI